MPESSSDPAPIDRRIAPAIVMLRGHKCAAGSAVRTFVRLRAIGRSDLRLT
jgi:hypothetical protein